MPTFHLHQFRGGRCVVADDCGGAYNDISEAIEDAVLTAREIMGRRVHDGLAIDDSAFLIVDANGRRKATVPFAETLSSDGSFVCERWLAVTR